jgi:hypothetical protein
MNSGLYLRYSSLEKSETMNKKLIDKVITERSYPYEY